MDTTKKLVRGLKDVSPLFSAITAQKEVFFRQTPELQVLAVSSPEYDGDSLFLNAFFASQLVSPKKSGSLVSILSHHSQNVRTKDSESLGRHLQRHYLYGDELTELLGAPSVMPNEGILKNRDIFLDFEYQHLVYMDSIIRLLDKWVLLLRPTSEALIEGYKMMKAGFSLNPLMEFFIAFEQRPKTSKGEKIFEQFSEFVFKHLSVDLGWLGWVDLSDPAAHFSATLHTDQLLFQPWNERPSLEKFILANWIESLEQKTPNGCFEKVS